MTSTPIKKEIATEIAGTTKNASWQQLPKLQQCEFILLILFLKADALSVCFSILEL